ncbi:MAG: hypothetical protein HKM24_05315 [Gammaproteobacteria bacterium]|nr:hypothetical protein [Gammaproteobacteria bacterium]
MTVRSADNVSANPSSSTSTSSNVSDQWSLALASLKPRVASAKASSQDLQDFFSQVREAWRALHVQRIDPSRVLDELVIQQIETARPAQHAMISMASATTDDQSFKNYSDLLTNALSDLLCFKYPQTSQMSKNPLCFDHYRYLLRELFLNIVADCLVQRRYHVINHLLSHHYLIRAALGPAQCLFLNFDSFVISLDEYRKRRLALDEGHRPSVEMMIDAAKDRSVDDRWLMQADLLLCLRSYLHSNNATQRWSPITLIKLDSLETDVSKLIGQLFISDIEHVHSGDIVKTLLGIDSRQDLIDRYHSAQRFHLPQAGGQNTEIDAMEQLLSLSLIAS